MSGVQYTVTSSRREGISLDRVHSSVPHSCSYLCSPPLDGDEGVDPARNSLTKHISVTSSRGSDSLSLCEKK